MAHEPVSKDRVWVFVLACFALFVILEYFRLSFVPEFLKTFCADHKEYCHGFNELARDLALGFFPIGLTIVLMEYWLRSQTKEEIKEYIESEVSNILKGKLKRLSDYDKSGLEKVWGSFGPEELPRFIASAKKRIMISVPFFVEPEVLEPILEQKARNADFSIKILTLHPDSIYLQRRGEIIFGRPLAGKLEAEKTLRMLKRALGGRPTTSAEVRVFDSLLTAFLVVADNRALIGFYMSRGTALKNPHIEARIRDGEGELTPLGEMIEREFRIALSNDFSSKVDFQVVSASGDFTLPTPPKATNRGPLAGLGGNTPVL